MNYELAVRLRDAGFPQRKGFDGDDTSLQIRYGFPTYVCEHGNKCPEIGQCGSKVYYPKLAELIDACGELFGALVYENGKWAAVEKNPKLFRRGIKPEESVAHLWLTLKSKPPVAL